MNYSQFKKQIDQFIDTDLGGRDRANGVLNQIIAIKQNYYKYKNWPFESQTPQELEFYLYNYGVVSCAKIPSADGKSSLIFFPVIINVNSFVGISKSLVTKLNIGHAKIEVAGEFKSGLIKTLDEISEGMKLIKLKKLLPFIFDNSMQYIPANNQKLLMQDLTDIHNLAIANRSSKNKQFEIDNTSAATDMSIIWSKILMQTRDMSPWIIAPSNNKDNPKQGYVTKSKQALSAPDLFNSIYSEKDRLIQELLKANNIFSSVEFQKSSAQETNSQTQSLDRDVVIKLKAEIANRKYWLKNLNSIFKTNVELELTADIKVYLTNALSHQNLMTGEQEILSEKSEEKIDTIINDKGSD